MKYVFQSGELPPASSDNLMTNFESCELPPVPYPSENKDDKVNHPNHYTFGNIEVIDYIRDKMTPDEFQGYCMGNILKYISRHKHKNGVEDLKKAQVYLGWLIESEEGAK